MGILSWAVMGLLAGMLAKWILPGKHSGGIILTMLLGIVGAVVGGWIGSFFGLGKINEFNAANLALAVGGAVVVLLAYRAIKGK
jgi:uncharacterized membrane protein YeaQ/YmgE (transglycosylase-associated protein family)